MSNHGLTSALQETSSLLRSVAAHFWADKIDRLLEVCGHEPSAREAQKILSWYGSMGSFNDLLISTVNGHAVREKDEKAFNDRLAELRELIFSEASELARESDISGSRTA